MGIVARHVAALEQRAPHRGLSSSSSSDCVLPSTSSPINNSPWSFTTRFAWQDGSPLGWDPAGFPECFDFEKSLRSTVMAPPWHPRGPRLERTARVNAPGAGRVLQTEATNQQIKLANDHGIETMARRDAQPASSQPTTKPDPCQPRSSNRRRRLVQPARALQAAMRQEAVSTQADSTTPSPARASPAQEEQARCACDCCGLHPPQCKLTEYG